MPAFTPGPCIDKCGTTLTRRDTAVRHWRFQHKQPHPYDSHQGQHQLRPLLEQWNALSPTLPAYEKGRAALRLGYDKKLHESNFGFIATDLADTFSHTPWWQRILQDIAHVDNANVTLISSGDGLPLGAISISDLASSLFYSAHPDLPASVAATLCGAVDVRPSSSQGLQACKYRIDGKTATYGVPAHGLQPHITMAVTPAGHITEVHQDGVWDASILTQVIGEKILFLWPPTNANLETAAHVHRGGGWILDAIGRLEQGAMVHLVPGCKIHLPLGTFHAVLSLTPSVLIGHRIHARNDLRHIPRLLRWDVMSTLKCHTDRLLLREVIKEHDDLLCLWLEQHALFVDEHENDLILARNLWNNSLRKLLDLRAQELRHPSKRSRTRA